MIHHLKGVLKGSLVFLQHLKFMNWWILSFFDVTNRLFYTLYHCKFVNILGLILFTLHKNFIFYIIFLLCHLFLVVKLFFVCLRHILRIFYKKLLFCSNTFYVTKSVKPRSSHVMISQVFKAEQIGVKYYLKKQSFNFLEIKIIVVFTQRYTKSSKIYAAFVKHFNKVPESRVTRQKLQLFSQFLCFLRFKSEFKGQIASNSNKGSLLHTIWCIFIQILLEIKSIKFWKAINGSLVNSNLAIKLKIQIILWKYRLRKIRRLLQK